MTALEVGGSLIWSDGPQVAVLGVEDLVVIAAGGAVLAPPRGRAQDVRAVVERLKASEALGD